MQVNFHRVSANWVAGQLPPTLNELTFNVPGGSLCALVGSVGSGKSALLNVLLRELQVGAGNVSLRQTVDQPLDASQLLPGFHSDNPGLRVSYACQDAWLFCGTVRDNILFGQPFDPQRYSEVSTHSHSYTHLATALKSRYGSLYIMNRLDQISSYR